MKIPIKKYVMDESLSWEERYKRLEAHHEEETKFLIERCKELEKRHIPVDWVAACVLQFSDSMDGNFRLAVNRDVLVKELEKLGLVLESHARSECPRLSVRGCGRCRDLTGDSY